MTFKAQELALWYDRDERGSDWNILSPTNSVAYSTLCVTPYHSESYLGFAGLTNLLYCVTLFILTSGFESCRNGIFSSSKISIVNAWN